MNKIILLISIFFTSYLLSNEISINTNTTNISILNNAQLYIDKDHKYFKYIRQLPVNSFIKTNKEFLNLSYTHDTIWLKFSIKNISSKSISKYLVIKNQFIDTISLYYIENNNYIVKTKGTLHEVNYDRKTLNFFFDINLKSNEKKIYYLKIHSISSPIFFSLNIMDKEIYYQEELIHQVILASVFGALFILIIYNAFIYLFTKDSIYLYYTAMIFFTALNHLSYTDMNRYILSKTLYQYDIFLALYYLLLVNIFVMLFFNKFLKLSKYKFINKIFKINYIISLLIFVSTCFGYYPIDLVVIFSVYIIVSVFLISLYTLYKKENNAKYLVVGWGFYSLGSINFALFVLGYNSILYEYKYFYEVTLLLEAIIFSVALANKLNTTEQLKTQLNTNEILTKELHHRVKNNMQLIISMYRLKLAKYSNVDINNSLNEIELTIQSMSKTHEMLYSNNDLKYINTKDYINDLLSKIKAINHKNITINQDIEDSLDVEKSIYIGIIINELVTNSFKYAFKGDTGIINIKLFKKKNKHHLIINDNGIGFDINKSTNSFGLEIVKILIKDKLNGKYIFYSNDGSYFEIIF
jgi:two-component sensor histidine kinase